MGAMRAGAVGASKVMRVVGVAGGVLLSASALGQTYVTLQFLPGGGASAGGRAVASPAAGQYRVVGVSDSSGSFAGEAWYFDLAPGADVPTSIGALPTGNGFSRAEDASASGAVIVGSSNYSGARTAGFRWTQAGGIVQIGPVGGVGTVAISRVHGCDSAGNLLVGESTTSTSAAALPHRWNVGATGVAAQALSTSRGQALGCSDNGMVIVGQRQTDFQAVRWVAPVPTGAVVETPLGFISPGESIAYAVNAGGNVIVGSSTSAALGGDTEAFIYTGTMRGIGALPAAAGSTPSSEAYAVSGDGRVVVGTSRTGGDFIDPINEAFVWTRRDGMRKLADVNTNVTFGYRLETADGISADGTVITGTAVLIGSNPVVRAAYVATIPRYCAADYNGVAGVTVQDIFDFLSGWFAGDLRADTTQDFALTVQDVFDFLSLWFAGCA